jgi:hypothetical protein
MLESTATGDCTKSKKLREWRFVSNSALVCGKHRESATAPNQHEAWICNPYLDV